MQLGAESFCENLRLALKESEIPVETNITLTDLDAIIEDFCNSFIKKCNEVVESNIKHSRLHSHVSKCIDPDLDQNSTIIEMLEAVSKHHDILSCQICRDYFDESFL
jgi:phosphatidylinositol kinase/protein kinase (PI-3  family)